MKRDGLILLGLGGLVLGFVAFAMPKVLPYRSVEKPNSSPPAEVQGDSMAPTWCGEHGEVTCPDCGFVQKMATQAIGAKVTCPQCGFALEISANNYAAEPADRPVLKKLTAEEVLQRHDLLVVQMPEEEGNSDARELQIKRLVALPGETWGTSAGDLLIDGEIWQKSAVQMLEVAQVMYDSRFVPQRTVGLKPRWSLENGADDNAGWKLSAEGERATLLASFPKRGLGEDNPKLEWLNYAHWRGATSPLPRDQEVALLDNDPFNAQQSRELNPITDILLQVEMRYSDSARLVLQVSDPQDTYVWEWNVEKGEHTLRKSGEVLLQVVSPLGRPKNKTKSVLTLALCDQTCFGLLNGQQIFAAPWQKPKRGTFWELPPLSKIRVGGAKGPLEILSVLLLRDLYYLGPRGEAGRWESKEPLGEDEYAVIGDNVTVSVDSRQLAPPNVKRGEILYQVERRE